MRVTNKVGVVGENVVFIPERLNYELSNDGSILVSAKTDSPDSHISLGGRGDTGLFSLNMRSGETYIIDVDAEVMEVLKSPVSSHYLTVAVDIIQNNQIVWNYAISGKGENAIGDDHLSVLFKIPEDATGAWVRLQGGMTKAGGKVRWKNFKIKNHEKIENNISLISSSSKNRSLMSTYKERQEYEKVIRELDEVANIWNSDGWQLAKKKFSEKKLYNSYPNIDVEKYFNQFQKNIKNRFLEAKWIEENFELIKLRAESILENKYYLNIEDPVFVWWAQGVNQAPTLVKKMIDKMQAVFKERLVILNEKNLSFYVTVPTQMEKIANLYRAHYSDYIRVALLGKYGGVWIDSTVLVSNEQYIQKWLEEVKSERSIGILNFDDPYRISSWFIIAGNSKRPFALLQAAFEIYWKSNDVLSEYFMLHTFFEVIIQLDRESFEIYNRRTEHKSKKGLTLEKNIYENYSSNEEKIKNILLGSPVHKLSYHAIDERRLLPDGVLYTILRNI